MSVIRSCYIVFVVSTFFACQGDKVNSSNHLANASSPYLREHADNPVNWYEWSNEALTKAKKENKPIIISIGYASCHWCHVMEEESFMDTAVARIMNENFISIKVDREERPDIDQVYISASQLLTGHAGWPLNAFALPDSKPFYAGTYFSKEQWLSLLSQVIEAYKNENATLVRQAEQVTQGVIANDAIIPLASNNNIDLKKTYDEIIPAWESFFDFNKGGLAGAPKFPIPVIWEFLLQDYRQTKNEQTLKAVTTTLDQMAKGGIYDQLAGGFARYSTDAEWKVPHFEKMLYDNGQLVSLYSHAYQVTRKEEYATVIKETLNFIETNLTSPEGGFYSSLNADSDGEEGTFYVWTKSEIEELLDQKSATIIKDYYNITDPGNWEKKKNVLHNTMPLGNVAAKHTIPEIDAKKILHQSRQILLTAREERIHPSLDDKILTSWNAIMMTGYVDAFWAFGNQEYLDIALKNAEFLKLRMIKENGKLLRSYSKGKASIDAFLDDYAFLSHAYIKLYEATFDLQWLNLARTITDYAVNHFHDSASGLFFYTSNESTHLIARKMEIPDQVIPSSNSVMADVLYTLGLYFEEKTYNSISLNMVNQISKDITQNGPYYAKWASLINKLVHQPFEVAIMGNEARSKSQELMKNYFPDILLMGGTQENLPLLENKLIENKTIIYVCRDKVCKLPVQEVDKAIEQLNAK